MKRLLLLLLAAAPILPQGSLLSEEAAGTAAFAFLKFPTGARSLALGGHAASLIRDASVMASGPAGLSRLNANDLVLSHEERFGGLRRECAGFALPTFRYGTFGMQWNLLTTGVIAGARDIDEQPVRPEASDMGLGFAWGRYLIDDRLAAGVHGQYLQSDLSGEPARGLSADASLLLHLPAGLVASIAARNLGPGISYTPGVSEPLPYGASGDVSWTGLGGRLCVVAGADRFGGAPLKAGAGAEFTPIPALALRAGYEYEHGADDGAEALDGLSFGTGLAWNYFRADYAFYRRSAVAGNLHVVDAGFRFGRLVQPTDRDYLRKAQGLFRQGRYEKSITAAQEALARNPSLWEAHMLIDEALRRIRVREKSVVALFYTGNGQGVLMPSSEQGLGGFPRRAGLLKSLRKNYPASLTVDAGNFLSTAADAARAEGVCRLLRFMHYDAVNLGDGEFARSLDTLFPMMEKNGFSVLSSNVLPEFETTVIADRITAGAGGSFRITLLGVAGPAKHPRRQAAVEDPVPALRPLVAEVRDSSDLVVVLSSQGLEECAEIAAAVPGIDVIVSGGSPKVTYTPEFEGKTLLVSPGQRGEYLGFLTLQLSANKKLVSYANRILPLDASVPEDNILLARMRGMVRAAAPEDSLPLIPSPYYLPFVSDSDMTAYHGRIRNSNELDSSARAELGDRVLLDSALIDSAVAALRLADSAAAAEAMAKGGLWGVADPADSSSQIYLRFTPTGKDRRISWNRRRNYAPRMSLQGSTMLYFSDTTVGRVTFVDSVDKRKVRTDLRVFDLQGGLTFTLEPEVKNRFLSAAFSSDGSAIYTVERDSAGLLEIYMLGVGRKARANVSRTPAASEYEIAVSPDGRNIAFTSDREEGRPLYLSDPQGDHPVRLVYEPGVYASPLFSGSGRYLAFTRLTSPGSDTRDLLLLEIGRQRLDTLVQNQRVGSLAWRGDRELYVTQGVHYTDLNVFDVGSRTMRRVTDRPSGSVANERDPVVVDFGDSAKIFFELEGPEGVSLSVTDDKSGRVAPVSPRPGQYRLK